MSQQRIIDLRSDTFSLPTREMREAMARAEVGNDEFGEDPTVNQLESLAAELLGKQAALFVPSGSMGNLIAMLAQAEPGRAAIIGIGSHIHIQSAPEMARYGGVITAPVEDYDDLPDEGQIRSACSRTPGRAALLALENTHNRVGVAVEPRRIAHYGELAQSMGLRLHIDGARLFNAAVALGVSAAELAAPADSVMFCLSKGLCAPVGSLLVSDRETIRRGHRIRKQLGGQMRQAGILAAAGIVSLTRMIARLAEDHANARRLAAGLRALPGARLVNTTPQTNIVICSVTLPGVSPQALVERAASEGVRCFALGDGRIRFCLYKDVSTVDVDLAIAALRRAAESLCRDA